MSIKKKILLTVYKYVKERNTIEQWEIVFLAELMIGRMEGICICKQRQREENVLYDRSLDLDIKNCGSKQFK